jgi:hypothetical protein
MAKKDPADWETWDWMPPRGGPLGEARSTVRSGR